MNIKFFCLVVLLSMFGKQLHGGIAGSLNFASKLQACKAQGLVGEQCILSGIPAYDEALYKFADFTRIVKQQQPNAVVDENILRLHRPAGQ